MSGWTWISVTLFAVIMQTVRTAGQKHLTAELSPVTTTLVRFLFGLPFVLAYFAAVSGLSERSPPPLNPTFVVFVPIGGVAQILATFLLVYLFSLRNFAVGTTYARTEAFLTAVVGATAFGELIAPSGWVAILVSVAGVVLLTVARTELAGATWAGRLWNRAAGIGLLSGLCFAVASLSIRKASLSFEIDSFLLTAATTLGWMVTVQTLLMLVYVAHKTPHEFAIMIRRWRVCLFVGVTSALGSIGWFTAMTLERASYVKALGQVEFLFALAISTFFFRERTNRLELLGMALLAVGIGVLVIAG